MPEFANKRPQPLSRYTGNRISSGHDGISAGKGTNGTDSQLHSDSDPDPFKKAECSESAVTGFQDDMAVPGESYLT